MPLIKGRALRRRSVALSRPMTSRWRGDAARHRLAMRAGSRSATALSALGRSLACALPNDLAAPELARRSRAHFAPDRAVDFPKFTDGRAYSQARLLRGRYGYRGELRANGDVLRDQLLFMQRCGFDAFVVRERAHVENWLARLARDRHFLSAGRGSAALAPCASRRGLGGRDDFTDS